MVGSRIELEGGLTCRFTNLRFWDPAFWIESRDAELRDLSS